MSNWQLETVSYLPGSRAVSTICFEAEEKATKPLWSVTIAGNNLRKVVDQAVSGEAVVSPDGKALVFAKCPADFLERRRTHSCLLEGASISCKISITRVPRSMESSR